MLKSRSAHRGLLVLTGVIVAMGLWLSPAQLATAQSPCPTDACIWLPLVIRPEAIRFVGSPYVRVEGRSLSVDGEIVTTIGEPLYNVLLEARVFNAAGNLVQTIPITPVLMMTSPTLSNPFFLQTALCCDAARAELSVRSWQATSATTYVNLPVTTLRWTLGDGFAVSVRNELSVPVYDVKIVVHHTLSRLYIHQLPVLAPGATAIYDNPEGDDPLGFFFRTWAQGRLGL